MDAFQPAVDLMASRRNGTLYCGSTVHLSRRIFEHKEGAGSRFCARYGVTLLVWYELHDEIGAAIQREYRIKQWNRAWKLQLIEAMNPTWRDLYADLV